MALPKKYDFNDYDNYLTDANPTTSAEAQDYFRNMDSLVGALVDAFLWQPETNYANGDVVKSDSMPNGAEAVCVSTNGGKSSNVEPQWGNVGGENIADGTCFWKLRWEHWSKENATNRLPNTNYAVGNVVYDRSNLSVALKCTTAGTTSNTELDISNNVVGNSVSDGSVVWQVVERYENAYNLANYPKRSTSYTLDSVVACPYHVEFLLKCTQAGRTSDGALDTTNVTKGRVITDGGAKWTVIAKAIIDASISGKNITFTFADGTTKVVTTQDSEKPADMNDYIIESYRNGTEWYEVYKSGKVRQGGIVNANGGILTFLKPFANTNYFFTTGMSAKSGSNDYNWNTNKTAVGQYDTRTTTGINVGHNSVWYAEGQGA